MKRTLSLLAALWASSANAQSAGALLVTEYMANPAAVADALGEYVEIYNTTGAAVNVNGCTLGDDGTESHTIANGSPLLVPAGDFLVMGPSADRTLNGGVPVSYVYTGFTLANADDEIVLTCSGVVVTRVTYTDGDLFGVGVSNELDNVATHPTGALVGPTGGTDFHAATMPYGAGDRGSPGAFGTTLTVGVGDGGGDAIPLALDAPYPNPATGGVQIHYTLAASGHARLTVVDALGRLVSVLADGLGAAGAHEALWDGGVAPGVYVVRLATEGGVQTRQVTVFR